MANEIKELLVQGIIKSFARYLVLRVLLLYMEVEMIDNDNYILITGWMVNELKLSGSELFVYALIYGFSQDGESKFNGSRRYIAEWFNCSLPTIDKALDGLLKKELIIKDEEIINGVKFNRFSIDKKILQGIKKLYRGSKETLHNNTIYNTSNINNMSIIYIWEDNLKCECETVKNNICERRASYNINGKNYCNQHSKPIIGNFLSNTTNDESNDIKEVKNRYKKPTIEEIKQYCEERQNLVDAEQFYDFYESKNWMVGKNKMKDWKACVRTWERRTIINKKKSNKGWEDDFWNE